MRGPGGDAILHLLESHTMKNLFAMHFREIVKIGANLGQISGTVLWTKIHHNYFHLLKIFTFVGHQVAHTNIAPLRDHNLCPPLKKSPGSESIFYVYFLQIHPSSLIYIRLALHFLYSSATIKSNGGCCSHPKVSSNL